MKAGDEYGTPRFLYEALDQDDDALAKSWQYEVCFMNPPYSNPEPWVRKAYEETETNDCPVVVGWVRLDLGFERPEAVWVKLPINPPRRTTKGRHGARGWGKSRQKEETQ